MREIEYMATISRRVLGSLVLSAGREAAVSVDYELEQGSFFEFEQWRDEALPLV